MGRYLEDFHPGDVIKHWPGRTIREFDNTWFTLLTLNTNPLHFDEHFASKSQHGRCLVNGTLVFSKLQCGRFPDDGEVDAILTGNKEPVLS